MPWPYPWRCYPGAHFRHLWLFLVISTHYCGPTSTLRPQLRPAPEFQTSTPGSRTLSPRPCTLDSVLFPTTCPCLSFLCQWIGASLTLRTSFQCHPSSLTPASSLQILPSPLPQRALTPAPPSYSHGDPRRGSPPGAQAPVAIAALLSPGAFYSGPSSALTPHTQLRRKTELWPYFSPAETHRRLSLLIRQSLNEAWTSRPFPGCTQKHRFPSSLCLQALAVFLPLSRLPPPPFDTNPNIANAASSA